MLVLGITGSAAMGKSTVAGMFAAAGVPVFDADRVVHDLYRAEAVPVIEHAYPGTVVNGSVDRTRLSARVLGDKAALSRLEALVHPLVRAREDAFRGAAASGGRRVIALDIPLLLETGGESRVDAVIVASAPEPIQRARLLARPAVNESTVVALRALQMPDEGKRRRAHFIIDTGGPLADTRSAVAAILRAVAGMAGAG